MPLQPTPASLHIDKLMTDHSIAYRNKQYIADTIFPVVTVKKQSDRVPKYDQSHWFRDEAKLRTPGAKSQRGGFSVDTTQTYFCDRYSYGFEIADEQRDNQDEPFDLDRDATEFATDKVLMRREVSFATNWFATSKWGTDKVGGTDFTKWSDYAGSQPLVDIATYRDVTESLGIPEPNMGILGKQGWLQVKWHPDLIDTIKYTQKGQLSIEQVATLFELDQLLIGRSIYTTSPEGTAEASVTYTRIWGKNMLLLYTPGRPSLLTPAAGYCYTWARVPGSLQYIKRMRDEEKEIDVLEANSYFTHVQTAKNAGVFLSNVVQ